MDSFQEENAERFAESSSEHHPHCVLISRCQIAFTNESGWLTAYLICCVRNLIDRIRQYLHFKHNPLSTGVETTAEECLSDLCNHECRIIANTCFQACIVLCRHVYIFALAQPATICDLVIFPKTNDKNERPNEVISKIRSEQDYSISGNR